MRYWHLFSLVSLAAGAHLLLSALNVTEQKAHQTSMAKELVETKVPLETITPAMPAKAAHCGAITKAHKHQIDDWLLTLQTQDKLNDWQANLSRLPV